MRKFDSWRRKLASIQEWSSVERACIPIVLAALLYLQYYLWGRFALARDAALADHAFLWPQGLFAAAVITAAALLVMAGRHLVRVRPEALWFQHLGANFYSVSLVWGVYLTGTLSLPAGVVLAGAPLLGFLLLDRRVALLAFAVTFGLILALNGATAAGLLPYAPALPAPVDTQSALFWVDTHLLFATPHLLVNIGLCAVLLDQWRRREARVLELSFTDALTGVHSRRHILDLLEAEVARARRHGTPFAVAMVDLDHFKRINDRFGHPAGDRVLRAAAQALTATLRHCDAVGRFGGEEFLLLLPGTGAAEAAEVLEDCRRALAVLVLTADSGDVIPVTGSFGLACCDTRLDPVGGALLHAADAALYAAKRAGRNRVVVADRDTVAAAVDADAGQLAATSIRRATAAPPWWLSVHGWRRRAASILEWSTQEKAALFLALLLVMQAGALSGVIVDLQFADAAALRQAAVARTVLWLQLALEAATMLLLGVAIELRKRDVALPRTDHVALQFGAVAMVVMGYGTGILGISTGVALTVVPLVAFILFQRAAVLAALATALAGVAGLAYASATGALPYAPLLSLAAPAWHPGGAFQVLTHYLFFLPLLCGGLVLADQILGRWREREAQFHALSLTDALTGVHNRRSILGLLAREAARAERTGMPLAVVILDLDYFKMVNDTFGHHAGDRVLQETTRVLRATVRQCDAVGRIGGEEFLLLLPGTAMEGALVLAERCRQRLAATVFLGDHGERLAVTASFGLAVCTSDAHLDGEALVRRADDALYQAKEAGRNRVEAGVASAA
ncbi:MAG: hypothetical protein K0S16_145 [Moraxellaceae bacterium]|nr:hypothetical protein [Moraxellaceae bacterium]